MTSTARSLYSVMAFGTLTALAVTARAQVGVGTGGASGVATLTDADIYVNIQRQEGVNLNDRERALFLNRSNCQCGTEAWVKAVIQPSAALRATQISPSASVSLYVGNACDPINPVSCCHHLASVPFSEFRLHGISVKTTVDLLVRDWQSFEGNCRETFTTTLIGPGPSYGTGGVGTGGTDGTGGTTGTGGVGGGGTGGAGTGGTTAPGPIAACDATITSQAINVFIGTTGEGSRDIGSKILGFSVDPIPPAPPTNVVVAGVNQALQVSWTGLSTAQVGDLLGYQAICTRGEATQVFKDSTFTAGFDACPAASTSWPSFGTLPASAFVCSDLLPTSATSTRLKILENDINYYVGITAIDRQRNASPVDFRVQKPILTKDFYFEYRNGDPQGGAGGGFCSVSGAVGGLTTAVGLGAGLLGAVAVARIRRRSVRRRSKS